MTEEGTGLTTIFKLLKSVTPEVVRNRAARFIIGYFLWNSFLLVSAIIQIFAVEDFVLGFHIQNALGFPLLFLVTDIAFKFFNWHMSFVFIIVSLCSHFFKWLVSIAFLNIGRIRLKHIGIILFGCIILVISEFYSVVWLEKKGGWFACITICGAIGFNVSLNFLFNELITSKSLDDGIIKKISYVISIIAMGFVLNMILHFNGGANVVALKEQRDFICSMISFVKVEMSDSEKSHEGWLVADTDRYLFLKEQNTNKTFSLVKLTHEKISAINLEYLQPDFSARVSFFPNCKI